MSTRRKQTPTRSPLFLCIGFISLSILVFYKPGEVKSTPTRQAQRPVNRTQQQRTKVAPPAGQAHKPVHRPASRAAVSHPRRPASRAAAAHRATQPTDAEAALKQLFADAWAFELRDRPVFASILGYRRYNHKLRDVSVAAQKRRQQAFVEFRRRLRKLDQQKLSVRSQLNYALFQRKLRDEIEALHWKTYLIPITNRRGFHIDFAEIPRRLSFKNAEDYLAYTFRLKACNKYIKQNIALMELGRKRGYTLPGVVLRGYSATIRPHIIKDARKSRLYYPFLRKPKNIDAASWKRLTALAQKTIMTYVVPALQHLLVYMTKTYIPQARKTIAASALPDGRAYYAYLVRYYTTLPLTPAQIHQMGQEEVRRIHKAIRRVIERTKFKGSFAAFLQYVRTSPRFYAKTPRQLLEAASFALKRMDGVLPTLFSKLPRMSYGIRPVPAYIAHKKSKAYYVPPAGDGSRAGFYYVNTYNLKSRPLYEIQALSFHEAVPGHHLQIALQQERKQVPPFRRFYRPMAFQEGWALYAERLGLEVGFYKDPYSNFGRLTYELCRAARLVVDTGIHWHGWSRKKAIKYMTQNTSLSSHNIKIEVDRYISTPAQALAYKIGELKIRGLRKRAEQSLGEHFDLRLFHDAILAQGAIPLDLLDEEIQRLIKRQKQKHKLRHPPTDHPTMYPTMPPPIDDTGELQ